MGAPDDARTSRIAIRPVARHGLDPDVIELMRKEFGPRSDRIIDYTMMVLKSRNPAVLEREYVRTQRRIAELQDESRAITTAYCQFFQGDQKKLFKLAALESDARMKKEKEEFYRRLKEQYPNYKPRKTAKRRKKAG